MKHFFIIISLFIIQTSNLIGQVTYYSKNYATNFNDVNSWGTNSDGSGTSPISITNSDNYVIQNLAYLTLNGNASVRNLLINLGSLSINSDTLKVELNNANNTEFVVKNGGIFNLSGTGVLDVRGAVYFAGGSAFNQNGGLLTIDGNSGNAATSIGGSSGNQPILGFGFTSNGINSIISDSTTFKIQSGIIRLVDPPFSTSLSARGISFSSFQSIYFGTSHILELGDNISTQSGGTSSGFNLSAKSTNYILGFGNVIVNTTNNATNRNISYLQGLIIQKNLTINTGELITNNELFIGGNIINNGTLTSIASVTFSNLRNSVLTPVVEPQEVSGNGVFRNATTNPKTNFNGLTINNTSSTGVSFMDDNSLMSGTNTGTSSSVNFTKGLISTNGRTFILGSSTTAGGTFTHTSGGFSSGSILTRWVGTSAGIVNVGNQPVISSNSGAFPFATPDGKNRAAFISYTGATTAGKITVNYNANGYGIQPKNIIDGTYAIQTQSKESWTFSQSGITSTSTCIIVLNAQDLYPVLNGNSRISLENTASPGTHLLGTIYPTAFRSIAFSAMANTYFIGATSADIPFQSINSGKWQDITTWNKGVVPSCNDAVFIGNTHEVVVNNANGNCKSLTINIGGKLTITGSKLTVGCTNNNNLLQNNGILRITEGKLTVNGRISSTSGSTFTQSGGEISIDGNAGGVIANSATGSLLEILTNNLTLDGGKIIFVDPHTSTTIGLVFDFQPSTITTFTCGNFHTFQFGNGLTTDPGGHANGYIFKIINGSLTKFNFGNIVLDAPIGTNNVLTMFNSVANVINNLTINKGEFRVLNLSVGGNILNNGILTNTGTIELSKGNVGLPSNNVQVIEGNGVFRNAATGSTGSIKVLNIYNASIDGVLLNVPLSITTSLGLYNGIIRVSPTALLTLGTTTSAATLNIGSSTITPMIEGPFARTFAANRTAIGTFDNTTLFPIGRGFSYLPIHIDPSTNSTSAATIVTQAYNTNSGSNANDISALSNNRWEYSKPSSITSAIFRIPSSTIFSNSSVFVQADSAKGIYNSINGVTSTVNLNLLTSSAILASALTGYMSNALRVPCETPTTQATNWQNSYIGASGFSASFTPSSTNPTGYLIVRYLTGQTVTNPVNGTSYSVGNSLGQGTVAYVGNNTTINFSGLNSGTGYSFFVYSYNFSNCFGINYYTNAPLIGNITTCNTILNPPTLGIKDRTNTEFTVSWQPFLPTFNGFVVNYNIEISDNPNFNTNIPGFPKIFDYTTSSIRVTNLTINTPYYARIRLDVNGCYGPVSAVVSATTTNCITFNLPVSIDFEGSLTLKENCWDSTKVVANTPFYVNTASPTPIQGTQCLRFNSYNYESQSRLISPKINITNLNTIDIRFFWYESKTFFQNFPNDGVQVQYSYDKVNWFNSGAFIKRDASSETGWVLKKQTIAVSGQTVYVGLLFKTKDANNLYIDDIKITTTPNCTEPTNLQSTVNYPNVTFSWQTQSQGSIASSFQWELRNTGFGGSGATGLVNSGLTNALSVAITNGIAQGSTYNFYVRSNCSQDSSIWIGPIIIKIPCNTSLPWSEGFENLVNLGTNANINFPPCWAIANSGWETANSNFTNFHNPRTGNQYLTFKYSSSGTIWTPTFLAVKGRKYVFKFWYIGDGFNGWTGNIYLSPNQGSPLSLYSTDVFINPNDISPTTYTQVTKTFIARETQIVSMAIAMSGGFTPWYLGFDDFSLEEIPYVNVNAKVFLNNVDVNTGIMDDYMTSLSSFPLSDPYSVPPLDTNFTHVNNPSVATIQYLNSSAYTNNNIVDWMFLELRSGAAGATSVVYTKAVLLQKDGDIVESDGYSPVTFQNAPLGDYYIAIRHRNSLGFRTNNLITLDGNPIELNFTNGSIPLYGSSPLYSKSTIPLINCMIPGDSNSDGSIDAFDSILWQHQNGLFDLYNLNADYNMDGSVDAFDAILWELNNGKFQELD